MGRIRPEVGGRGRLRPEVDDRGFTLIELIVTLIVVALAVGLVIPAIGRSTESVRARSEVARFSAMFRHAREQAIATQRGHAVVIDLGTRRTLLVAAPDEIRQTRALPPDLQVEANPPNALAVRFDPTGVTSGGDFRLTTGQTRFRVMVDPLTGRVRSERQ